MKRKPAYIYSQDIESYNFGSDHPMKPKKVAMTHDIVEKSCLLEEMDIYVPQRVSLNQMTNYHDPNYIQYIKKYYDNDEQCKQQKLYGIGVSSDTPAFPKFYEFCQLTSGASLLASEILIQDRNDVVIDWMGGYHHAKKAKASGFCYVNDIVLSIQRLLENFDRVLYIDIDVHHGDGVEEAFYHTDRVCTLSIHQYDEETKFFPGTGNFNRQGTDEGRFFAVNVPLKPGCDDDTYMYLFDNIFERLLQVFRPDVIFLQCGADSLIGDIIGRFRLSTKTHGNAVQKVLQSGIPCIMSGGGGYTIQNVSRCWAYETSLACGIELPDTLPKNLYFYEYYKDEPYLHIFDSQNYSNKKISYWKFDKQNLQNYAIYDDKNYREEILSTVFKQLKKMEQRMGMNLSRNLNIIPYHNQII